MPGLSLASDADAVMIWLDRLSLDETVFDNLAALDGAELSLSERMSNILIKTTGAPFITESHHRLALRLLLHGANPNRKSHGHWRPLHLAARARGNFSLDLVTDLLANGAEPNARTAHGAGNKTPLAVAPFCGRARHARSRNRRCRAHGSHHATRVRVAEQPSSNRRELNRHASTHNQVVPKLLEHGDRAWRACWA